MSDSRRVDQVRTFRDVLRVQSDLTLHPLTCGNCSPPERDDFPLVPWIAVGGLLELRCPLGCGWCQPVSRRLADLVQCGAELSRETDRFDGADGLLKRIGA